MSESTLSIVEALDNLNLVVDTELMEQLCVSDEGKFYLPAEPVPPELSAAKDPASLEVIKQTLQVVYHYVISYYDKMRKNGNTQELLDAMNSMVVLVGEAARKFDECSSLFEGSFYELPEYKRLYSFYKSKLVHELYKDFTAPLKRAKIRHAKQKKVRTDEAHVLDDIEVIKKDHMYELFYMKNEAGNTFFTQELERRIKLACDFDEFKGKYMGEDPLLQIKSWEDYALFQHAGHLLEQLETKIKRFFRQANHYKDDGLTLLTSQCLMALMLAANPSNLIRQFCHKPCYRYYNDFLGFLREAMRHRDFQKYLIYSPPANIPFFHDVMDLLIHLGEALFIGGPHPLEANRAFLKWFQIDENKNLSKQLNAVFQRVDKVLKAHPSGPVFKALDLVREKRLPPFDPILQGNHPQFEYEINWGGSVMIHLRMPTPVDQRSIHCAHLTEEFTTFLHALKWKDRQKKLLWINSESELDWQQQARAHALAELSNQKEFANQFILLNLPTCTDFYAQKGEYYSNNEIELFRISVLDAFEGEGLYQFPQELDQLMRDGWFKQMFENIHKTFFQEKTELSQEQRCQFISLIHLYIELKSLEFYRPDYFVHGSKDGLDETAVQNGRLLSFISTGQKRAWAMEELHAFFSLLLIPTLMVRERSLFSEQTKEIVSIVETFEKTPNHLKKAGELFQVSPESMSFHFYKE